MIPFVMLFLFFKLWSIQNQSSGGRIESSESQIVGVCNLRIIGSLDKAFWAISPCIVHNTSSVFLNFFARVNDAKVKNLL